MCRKTGYNSCAFEERCDGITRQAQKLPRYRRPFVDLNGAHPILPSSDCGGAQYTAVQLLFRGYTGA